MISAIAGMAGVGKTQLAIHAGHLLAREQPFDRVLFVNLRGFHPDPAQPPADPAAVLDGFLRLLGVPGQQIPHGLRRPRGRLPRRLAGTRTLVVLDNAADADQVRPLLPDTAGCPTLVTSRRSLTGLGTATHLTVDVFTPDEARGVPDPAVADVPSARTRTRRPGSPSAAATCRWPSAWSPRTSAPRLGWTLTDHADRLDERHHDRRLDTGVELALEPVLPAPARRPAAGCCGWWRCTPARTSTRYAAAALAGTDLPAAQDAAGPPAAATTCCTGRPRAGTPSTTWSAPTPPPGPATRTPRPTAAPP